MKVLKFKTNIDSTESVKTVSSYLDQADFISKWKLDTESPEKILSVSGDHLEPHMVKDIVKKAGFNAEVVQVIAVGGGDV